MFAVPLLNQLNVPDDVFPLALLYLRIYLAGLPVILLYNFEAAVFRSVGETKIPLIALTASGVLNVILNLFFVAALHMSVDGVADPQRCCRTRSARRSCGVSCSKRTRSSALRPKKLRIDRAVPQANSAHRRSRGCAERDVLHREYRHSGRDQQPRHGRHGGIERGLQH
ncbi:MAG: MATE family efflux transporter [Oscillibacter sp.]